jgi:hypothetical protein
MHGKLFAVRISTNFGIKRTKEGKEVEGEKEE